jgi:large subunit ribosomal protein L3
VIGHDAKAGLAPKRHHREFRLSEQEAAEYQVGQELTVADLAAHPYVDVSARSKGKGYQGVMKRHNFKGQLATHGTERKHRSAGSIAGHSFNAGSSGGPKKGKKMAGQLGAERVTVRSLDVIEVHEDKGLVLVKGPVPGPNNAVVEIRPAIRLKKRKAKLAKAS